MYTGRNSASSIQFNTHNDTHECSLITANTVGRRQSKNNEF